MEHDPRFMINASGEASRGRRTEGIATYDRSVSDALTRALKERGLRLTAQRQLVLQAVRELGHATPDEFESQHRLDLERLAPDGRSCGSIQELDVDVVTQLADTLVDEQGFSLDMGHLALFGTCGGCR